jgi:glycosyltransferase involved in cell wall biosynthesis
MAQDGYPTDPQVWRSFARIEQKAIDTAVMNTFTTPSAVDLYKTRYPQYESRMHLLENGYDEAVFSKRLTTQAPLNDSKLTLLHSGIVYPSERDPNSLFAAMRSLSVESPSKYARLVIRFRAAVHDDFLQRLVRKFEIEDAVQILPPISYAEAIAEMQRADGLLILQASNCNAQIPAKFYEYLRAGPPVLMVTDPAGDTAVAARSAGIEKVARFGDPASIMSSLGLFMAGETKGMLPEKSAIQGATRKARTETLSELLDSVIS